MKDTLKISIVIRVVFVQKAAVRLLTNASRRDHITPVLYLLHWLPVSFRIDFKPLMFVFKAISGLATTCLSEISALHEHNRALRSSNHLVLQVQTSRYKLWGDRAYAVVAPKL